MLKIVLLGLSVSIDSWAVGAAYRAAEIRIPWLTKGIVALISGLTSFAAVLLGEILGCVIHTGYIQMAGGAVLVLIGAKSLRSVMTGREERDYDRDRSNVIEPYEGIVLGSVLASDSFCGGLSLCGMGKAAYAFPAIVGILTFLFLALAERRIRCGSICDYLAGAALAVLGIVQMLGW